MSRAVEWMRRTLEASFVLALFAVALAAALLAGSVAAELFGGSSLGVLFLWVASTIAAGAIPILVIRIAGIVFSFLGV